MFMKSHVFFIDFIVYRCEIFQSIFKNLSKLLVKSPNRRITNEQPKARS